MLQEQLEEALQELEGLRAKTDALKADNFTMIAEQNDEPASNTTEEAPVEANGDAGTHSAHGIADTDPASLQRIAELEVISSTERLEYCSHRPPRHTGSSMGPMLLASVLLYKGITAPKLGRLVS